MTYKESVRLRKREWAQKPMNVQKISNYGKFCIGPRRMAKTRRARSVYCRELYKRGRIDGGNPLCKCGSIKTRQAKVCLRCSGKDTMPEEKKKCCQCLRAIGYGFKRIRKYIPVSTGYLVGWFGGAGKEEMGQRSRAAQLMRSRGVLKSRKWRWPKVKKCPKCRCGMAYSRSKLCRICRIISVELQRRRQCLSTHRNKEKWRAAGYVKRANLTDAYVRLKLGMTKQQCDLVPGLVEAYREKLKLSRLIEQKQKPPQE